MRSHGDRTLRIVCMLFATGYLYVVGMGSALAEPADADVPAMTELQSQAVSDGTETAAPTDQQSDLFRQAPTLSGRLRVSEQTFIPYIGAGFGGGYVTERDRALNPQPMLPQQHLFGESMGKGMMPNEFQMGIRIPF